MRWILALLAATACGDSPAPQTPATSEPASTADAPEPAPARPVEPADYTAPPFSATEIRAGLPQGTELKLRIEAAGQPAVIQHWVFTKSDATGATIHARILDENGGLIRDEGSGSSTWEELETHAHFPADRTTRSESSVEVPAGRFDTWFFEVRPGKPGEPLKRFHFAKTLPGPPVLMEVVKDGTVVLKMVLLERTSG